MQWTGTTTGFLLVFFSRIVAVIVGTFRCVRCVYVIFFFLFLTFTRKEHKNTKWTLCILLFQIFIQHWNVQFAYCIRLCALLFLLPYIILLILFWFLLWFSRLFVFVLFEYFDVLFLKFFQDIVAYMHTYEHTHIHVFVAIIDRMSTAPSGKSTQAITNIVENGRQIRSTV